MKLTIGLGGLGIWGLGGLGVPKLYAKLPTIK